MNSNVDLAHKPKFVFCFLCGREFGQSSLEIHMRQCKEKLQTEREMKVNIPGEYEQLYKRVKSGEKIPQEELDTFNSFAEDLFKETTLCKCPNCGRRFLKDRLEVHLRSCKSANTKTSTTGNKKNSLTNSTSMSSGSNSIFLEKLEKQLKVEDSKNTSKSPSKFSSKSPSKSNTSKPMSLVCYMCGKEYGTHSLNIHLKSCEEAYLKDHKHQSTKPDLLETVLNGKDKIDFDIIESYNKQAEKIYRDTNFVACPNCARKFLPDRLEVHLKGCKTSTKSKGNDTKGSNESTKILEEKLNKELGKSKDLGMTSKPTFLMCYVCGREFGKHSLEIHMKTCIAKSDNKKMPNIPQELDEILAKVNMNYDIPPNEINLYNEVANKLFKEYSMKACPGCNRRFLPDRLEVHLKSCTKDSGGNSYTKGLKAPNMNSKPRMPMCPLCGREFGSLSLPIHMKQCEVKFEQEQLLLPVGLRRSAEKIIDKYNEANKSLKSTGDYNIDNINSDAFEIFNKEALVPCDRCGRTFLPDRLLAHQKQKNCKKK